jgi:beta-galactosidase
MNKRLLYYGIVALVTMLLVFPFGCISSQKATQASTVVKRSKQNINANWEYLEENHTSVEPLATATNWTTIDLPHTRNQWDATDLVPGYRRNASWYKKQLAIPNHTNATYKLYFEGVNTQAQVYVNGQKAGEHIGGYVGFEVDITQYVNKGETNELLVRADNGYNRDIIPSQKADFFIYGGIVRDVFLKILPDQHLEKITVSNL